ncbi:hypothetical protein [Bordetella petrii]|uniref:hypothetical protein n=1 Tax=Bordetella petrii TaxID=94624 RepID=UPI001E39287E|nr:hypothetical protein [Bordetella petrii]MCD0504589.1 hypothetical protein [Bordetella petrii]
MKIVTLLVMMAALAGCAAPGSREDLARYGTAPSEEDLYQLMDQYRNSVPPTRYVSYRDKGYADSVKKTTYTDEQGQPQYGWEYLFDVAAYDTIEKTSMEWHARRAIFFNGRPIMLLDQSGQRIRLGSQVPPVPAPAPAMGR